MCVGGGGGRVRDGVSGGEGMGRRMRLGDVVVCSSVWSFGSHLSLAGV